MWNPPPADTVTDKFDEDYPDHCCQAMNMNASKHEKQRREMDGTFEDEKRQVSGMCCTCNCIHGVTGHLPPGDCGDYLVLSFRKLPLSCPLCPSTCGFRHPKSRRNNQITFWRRVLMQETENSHSYNVALSTRYCVVCMIPLSSTSPSS